MLDVGQVDIAFVVHNAAGAVERCALAYQPTACAHERTARQHEACADLGIGDVSEHRERAGWHRAAAERARKSAAA
ncbi:hypothetical protein AB0F17_63775 [Nonomuraea sp. NPDC026600]|uniref:hypothetical protein n=1 Tax=Nonomuraea sp. NPDC026600 TaxID=3155363 RepID=UPI0033CF8563